ncbi:hypothetical protein [Moorena producens]|uniref:hypothetical protein n=1 Tax=Moorena producens TaxID=1155739 RepID=UPI001314FF82|nr:hypothetical protein [Moorena producens]
MILLGAVDTSMLAAHGRVRSRQRDAPPKPSKAERSRTPTTVCKPDRTQRPQKER